jgi:eukaryotic-like serine/threonine-protein kinase
MLLHNQYEFNPETDLIAKGGFAEVYLAYDRNLNKKVAIKRFVKDAGTAGSVIKEIQKSIDFNHHNIIRYFNCFTQEYKDHLGRTITEEYGVMEYANAGNLGDIISRRRKVTEEQFKQILMGILDGLQYLHSRQPALIHRDLKPSNILLHKENGQLIPKICDFGISKELQGTISQTTTAAIGTIDYMAPEQINGETPFPATDLWALGCIIYEYFNGQPPFGKITQGASAQQVYYKVFNGQMDKNAMQQIPEHFRALVKQCLVVDREKRVKSAEEGKGILIKGLTIKDTSNRKEKNPSLWRITLALLILITGVIGYKYTFFSKKTVELNKYPASETPATISPSESETVYYDEYGVPIRRRAEVGSNGDSIKIVIPEVESEDFNSPIKAAPGKEDKATVLPTSIAKLVSDMVSIPGGSFMMGCSPGDDMCRDEESPRHRVTLSAFKLGKFEVTQAQWQAVMNNNPSHFKNCDNCPVENVNWNDAQEFIVKLNQITGKRFRLPTEAEWEYAARGGTNTRFYTGNCLSTQQANYHGNYPASGCSTGNYREKTLPVGSFSSNGFGLYDMHGNVWEWCSDWYGAYRRGSQTNPRGSSTGAYRVFRGGSWYYDAQYCRVSNRLRRRPADRFDYLGFRLAHD